MRHSTIYNNGYEEKNKVSDIRSVLQLQSINGEIQNNFKNRLKRMENTCIPKKVSCISTKTTKTLEAIKEKMQSSTSIASISRKRLYA